MAKQIFITAKDKQRLMDHLTVLQESPDKRELPHIQYLEQEIERATIIHEVSATPKDVITMHSKVKLKDVTHQTEMECTLVYPPQSAPDKGFISVLAPLGAAMLGYCVGDSFEVDLPKGRTQYTVEAMLYQPEAAGDYHL